MPASAPLPKSFTRMVPAGHAIAILARATMGRSAPPPWLATHATMGATTTSPVKASPPSMAATRVAVTNPGACLVPNSVACATRRKNGRRSTRRLIRKAARCSNSCAPVTRRPSKIAAAAVANKLRAAPNGSTVHRAPKAPAAKRKRQSARSRSSHFSALRSAAAVAGVVCARPRG